MAKKIAISFSVVFAVVLAVIVFSLVGAAYSTDTAALLEEAKAYEAESNYGQAEAIYRSIVADYPGTDEAFQAQKNLAVLFITTGNYPAAQAEVDVLIADFTGHQGLPQVIYDLANSYWYAVNYQQARQLYKYIADQIPDSDLAILGRAWVAGCDMKMGNYTAANQEIDALMKDFADNPQLTSVICKLADEYWYAGRYEDSGQLYEYIAENHPYSDLDINLELVLGNCTSAQQVIDVLVRDCAGQSQLVLGWILYGNANGCWYVGKYKEARELYKYIADNLPESNWFMRAQLWVAGSDIKLGNYAATKQQIDTVITDFPDDPELPGEIFQLANVYRRAQRYEDGGQLYQHIIDNWPDFKYAGLAQLYIGKCYEVLRNSALISEAEANPLIEQAYKAVVEKYPNSPAVRDAAIRLGWLDFKKGQWVEAIQYWELSLKKSTEDRKPVHILYPLGRAYEEIGRLDLAAEVYNEFINTVPSTDPRIEKVKARLEKLAGL